MNNFGYEFNIRAVQRLPVEIRNYKCLSVSSNQLVCSRCLMCISISISVVVLNRQRSSHFNELATDGWW